VAERPLIAVVDDNESVRESLPDLLREFGFAARAFALIEQGAVECLFKPFSLYHRAMDHRSVVGISWCHGRLTLRPHDVSFRTRTP